VGDGRVHRKESSESLCIKGDRRLAVALFVVLVIGSILFIAF